MTLRELEEVRLRTQMLWRRYSIDGFQTLVHEAGHAAAALALGGMVFRIDIGHGEPLIEYQTFGIPIRVLEHDMSGVCVYTGVPRGRQPFVALGGPLASAMLTALPLWSSSITLLCFPALVWSIHCLLNTMDSDYEKGLWLVRGVPPEPTTAEFIASLPREEFLATFRKSVTVQFNHAKFDELRARPPADAFDLYAVAVPGAPVAEVTAIAAAIRRHDATWEELGLLNTPSTATVEPT